MPILLNCYQCLGLGWKCAYDLDIILRENFVTLPFDKLNWAILSVRIENRYHVCETPRTLLCWFFLKLYRCFCHGLRMCMCHLVLFYFISKLNLFILQVILLSMRILSGDLVWATLGPTVLCQSFSNVAGAYVSLVCGWLNNPVNIYGHFETVR